MKLAQTLSGAAAALGVWSFRSRESQETLGTNPEPHRACFVRVVSRELFHDLRVAFSHRAEHVVQGEKYEGRSDDGQDQGVGQLARARVVTTRAGRRNNTVLISRPEVVAAGRVVRCHVCAPAGPRQMGSRKHVPTFPSQDATSRFSLRLQGSSIVPARSRAEAQGRAIDFSDIGCRIQKNPGRIITRPHTHHTGIGEWPHDHPLFGSGTSHFVLTAGWLAKEASSRGAAIRLRLAAGQAAEGLVVGGEVYAFGVGRSLLTLGVHFVWGGDGPRLVARGMIGMYPVVWVHIRQGLPCTSMEQGDDIRSMMNKWKGNNGLTDYEDCRHILDLPLQQEPEPVNPDEPGKVPRHEDIGQHRPPGLVPPEHPPKLGDSDV